MSQSNIAEDRDIFRKFPATVYQVPKFSEELGSGSRKKLLFRVNPKKAKNKTAVDLKKRIDTHIYRLLVTAQSTGQFKELLREVFPEYVELSGAIGTIRRVFDKDEDQVAAANAAFSRIRHNLETETFLLSRYEGAREEALNCLDALHRAHFLAQDVIAGITQGVLPRESLSSYQSAISQEWWSLLHLRCIGFSIAHKIQPTDDVFFCLMDGFRHAVLSYAAARAAMEPKYKAEYADIDFSSLTPDAEDQYLADQADQEYTFLLQHSAEARHKA